MAYVPSIAGASTICLTVLARIIHAFIFKMAGFQRMYYGEKFNSISHLIGAALALVGTVVLVVLAAHTGDQWKIVSCSIFGAMLLVLYIFSTLYHSIRGQRAKDVLRKFDHCSIYLLIAGSYTPFMLVTLRETWGWPLLGAVWGLAAIGIVQEIWWARGARILSLVIYVVMGWLALLVIMPLIKALSWHGFYWLAAGGIFYTVGIIFYATDHKLRHGHGIWHLFVLAGSICHFMAILFYVV